MIFFACAVCTGSLPAGGSEGKELNEFVHITTPTLHLKMHHGLHESKAPVLLLFSGRTP